MCLTLTTFASQAPLMLDEDQLGLYFHRRKFATSWFETNVRNFAVIRALCIHLPHLNSTCFYFFIPPLLRHDELTRGYQLSSSYHQGHLLCHSASPLDNFSFGTSLSRPVVVTGLPAIYPPDSYRKSPIYPACPKARGEAARGKTYTPCCR
jgi:hypothetical protein